MPSEIGGIKAGKFQGIGGLNRRGLRCKQPILSGRLKAPAGRKPDLQIYGICKSVTKHQRQQVKTAAAFGGALVADVAAAV